jgi:two-component system chemotaxis response regulator CheB
MMSKIRALVVEDSQTVRRHLVALLQDDPDLDVIGEAADGRQAIDLCKTLRPDVIALDLVLPGIDGVAVTEHIMAYCPTPILIVSAAHSRQGRVHTRDALSAGAVDVLEKPDAGSPDAGWGRRFVATMKLVARIRVPGDRLGGIHRRSRGPGDDPAGDASPVPPAHPRRHPHGIGLWRRLQRLAGRADAPSRRLGARW